MYIDQEMNMCVCVPISSLICGLQFVPASGGLYVSRGSNGHMGSYSLARQWLLYVHHIYVCVSIFRYITCTRTFFSKIIFIATILITEQTKLL